MVVKEGSRKNRVKWCRERKYWSVNDNWSKWIFSDESQIVIGNNNKIFVWRKDDEKQTSFGVSSPLTEGECYDLGLRML